MTTLMLLTMYNLSSATNSSKLIEIKLERRPYQGRVERKLQEANLTDEQRNPMGLPEIPKTLGDRMCGLFRQLQYLYPQPQLQP